MVYDLHHHQDHEDVSMAYPSPRTHAVGVDGSLVPTAHVGEAVKEVLTDWKNLGDRLLKMDPSELNAFFSTFSSESFRRHFRILLEMEVFMDGAELAVVNREKILGRLGELTGLTLTELRTVGLAGVFRRLQDLAALSDKASLMTHHRKASEFAAGIHTIQRQLTAGKVWQQLVSTEEFIN